MSQIARSTPLLFLTFVYVVVTLVNASAQFAIFEGGPGDEGQLPAEQEADTFGNELDEDIGGMTQVTAIPVGIVTALMAVMSVGLLMNRGWAITGALITLGFDVALKAINILAEFTSGANFLDVLPAVAMIAVEALLFYFFGQHRQQRKAEEQPVRSERAPSRT